VQQPLRKSDAPALDEAAGPFEPPDSLMFIRATAGLHPLRVYERWETLAALMFASAPTPQSPTGLWRALPELWRWRNSPAGIFGAGAKRFPHRVAVVDDERALTFAELDRRTNALASEWRGAGIGPDTTVGLLARNSAMFIEAMAAAQKLGANLVFLNTGFAPPQVADVLAEEQVDVLVYSHDLEEAAAQVPRRRRISEADMARAIADGDPSPLTPPQSSGRVVVLTSGTTGRPKGAARGPRGNVLDTAALLTTIPLISGDTAVVPAPLFHGLGLFTATFSLALGSTVVLRPSFDAELTLQDVQRNGARVLVVVPAMLHRMLALPGNRLVSYDTSSLRVIVSGGAQLTASLARAAIERFGNVLYNIYGSTEVALATVATPRDLRVAPGTAGRPVPGVDVRIVNDHGHGLPPGQTGRILVGSRLRFDGYTGGGYKPVVDGLLATGDLGRVDRFGRLFVEGREDEMIVSGGENVFPAEVEEVLSEHPDVEEVAVVGVPDEEFGQRLSAFVVAQPGATADEDELRSYVRRRLARFKTPREVVFLQRLPRTATGKVRKRELFELPGEVEL
jgi:fatty-acyl-CoA synthase